MPDRAPGLTDSEFGQLLSQARRRDSDALGQLLNAFQPFLLCIAQAELDSDLREKVGPSDLVQETFIDAQNSFGEFVSHTRDELTAWLTTMLRNNLTDLRRRFKRSKKREVRRERRLDGYESNELLDRLSARTGETPSQRALSAEERERMLAAIDRLSPAYREIILWRYQRMLSWKVIAQQLDRSEDAARMLLQRAVKRLKKELADDEPP
jgi:RNA polymerase sigma-70 factor (ECF subfamily)